MLHQSSSIHKRSKPQKHQLSHHIHKKSITSHRRISINNQPSFIKSSPQFTSKHSHNQSRRPFFSKFKTLLTPSSISSPHPCPSIPRSTIIFNQPAHHLAMDLYELLHAHSPSSLQKTFPSAQSQQFSHHTFQNDAKQDIADVVFHDLFKTTNTQTMSVDFAFHAFVESLAQLFPNTIANLRAFDNVHKRSDISLELLQSFFGIKTASTFLQQSDQLQQQQLQEIEQQGQKSTNSENDVLKQLSSITFIPPSNAQDYHIINQVLTQSDDDSKSTKDLTQNIPTSQPPIASSQNPHSFVPKIGRITEQHLWEHTYTILTQLTQTTASLYQLRQEFAECQLVDLIPPSPKPSLSHQTSPPTSTVKMASTSAIQTETVATTRLSKFTNLVPSTAPSSHIPLKQPGRLLQKIAGIGPKIPTKRSTSWKDSPTFTSPTSAQSQSSSPTPSSSSSSLQLDHDTNNSLVNSNNDTIDIKTQFMDQQFGILISTLRGFGHLPVSNGWLSQHPQCIKLLSSIIPTLTSHSEDALSQLLLIDMAPTQATFLTQSISYLHEIHKQRNKTPQIYNFTLRQYLSQFNTQLDDLVRGHTTLIAFPILKRDQILQEIQSAANCMVQVSLNPLQLAKFVQLRAKHQQERQQLQKLSTSYEEINQIIQSMDMEALFTFSDIYHLHLEQQRSKAALDFDIIMTNPNLVDTDFILPHLAKAF